MSERKGAWTEYGVGSDVVHWDKESVQVLASIYKQNPDFCAVAEAHDDPLLHDLDLFTLCRWLNLIKRIAGGERKVWWDDGKCHCVTYKTGEPKPPQPPPRIVKDEDQCETWVIEALQKG